MSEKELRKESIKRLHDLGIEAEECDIFSISEDDKYIYVSIDGQIILPKK